MMGLKKSISFYFLLILFLSCNKPDQTYSYSGFALGTNFNILYNSDKPLKNLNKLTDSIFFDLNKSLSTYIPSSDISKINNGDNSIIVDENFKKVFNASKIIWEESGGYFDPTIGLLTNAYGLGPNTNPNYSINVDKKLIIFLEILNKVNSNLDNYKKMSKVVFVKEDWLPENGMTTPTLKIKRSKIDEKFSNQYNNWLKSSEDVIWE